MTLTPPDRLPDLALLDAECRARFDALVSSLRALARVVVAFSGGIDSTVLLQVAAHALGHDAVALTAVSESLAPWELDDARQLAARIGVRHLMIESLEMEREAYRRNAGDRCYHCKVELFEIAAAHARSQALGALVYGAIPEDLGDHRPGMRAAAEFGVQAPLIDAGVSKAQIREIARAFGLPIAEKPASACLASRFPDGTPIDRERLGRVTRCEGGLRALGLFQVRARFHEDLVRIELGPEELARVRGDSALREAVLRAGRDAGFGAVIIDPQGYRRGGAVTLHQVAEPRA